MNAWHRAEFILLGAIWGSSFLFMRIAAPEFGPLPLIEIRIAIAAAFLASILAWRGKLRELRGHALDLLVVGVINSALPFSLFAFATLSLPAGFASILNATAPLFGAIVGYFWVRDRLTKTQWTGLGLGFAGVLLLTAHKFAVPKDGIAVAAGLCAGLGYGIAAHYTKRRLASVPPLAIAAGSQIGASLALLPFAWLTWPQSLPSTTSLLCSLALGIVCTGVAYLLYFRSIAAWGAAKATTVAYLIPVFGVAWGALFLQESVTWNTLLGGAVILIGTTLVTRFGIKPAPKKGVQECPKSPAHSAL